MLDLRGQTWWFRMAVPAACLDHFDGKTMYMQSLNTGDIKQAMAQRDILEREVRTLFARVKAGEIITSAEEIAEQRGQIYREAMAAVTQSGDSEALQDLVWAAEAEEDALKEEARERFARAFVGDHPIDHHFDAYLGAIKLAPKTTAERRGVLNHFARWCLAEKFRLPDITRKTAGRYVTEVIEPMDRSTAKKHMTALRGYWEYLLMRGHVTGELKDNPWLGQEVVSKRRRVERGEREEERPYTEDELKRLLYARYPDGIDPDWELLLRDALTISCLSGMRQAEVLTLWIEDVHDGVFDIQQGKTEAAARKVPIHPALAEIIQRRTEGKEARDWLFHELAGLRDPGDTFGKRFNRFRVLLQVDDKRPGKRRSLVNFHSARRWFITEARHAGQQIETIRDVVGHKADKKKDITFGVYTTGASAAQLKACIEAVMLPSGG
ncbi:hypothetical protein C7U62_01285 [Mesorhizobium loti]|nr:hypothetical protein SMRU11_23715 [Sinorhizobium meliloti RU11/001]MDE3767798.1 tyrosine-type recombinase/integrase [Sinorhizobium meliloti]PST29795.1 hypothetical protein C7U62_01285 [Mesorhizobium loti]MDE3779570.1 tyrosine-type recombinase/integrase [Sinorhizobium meliloti]MDE3785802.1 tyrosine-type recombinase/integrase [Sinorhizobium meliloti]